MAAVKKVLVCDRLAQEGLDILLQCPDIQTDVKVGLGPDQLKECLADYDGIVVRSGTHLSQELIEAASRLQVICRAGVGVDNVDVPAATRRGIVVMNTPGGNTVSTAEHTIAMILALSRNIVPAHRSLVEGRWERSRFTGTQLAGKRLGVIGLGRVGSAVARRALGLEMEVIAFDPYMAPGRSAVEGVRHVDSLDELLATSDFISVHTPLSDDTRGLIGAREFARMKRGVRLINCARGGIVDEEALAEALRQGIVAGAALDVFSVEPPGKHPLLEFPNVLATPHLGASTEEAQINVAVEAARRIIDYLRTGNITFAVNMPNIDRAELQALAPYLELGYRMGLLHAQMARGRTLRLRLRYLGDIARRNTRIITASVVAGFLEKALTEQTNLVNAELLARERGIELVAETSSDQGDFTTLIETHVDTDKQTYTVSGTLFGHQYLRLVQIGPYRLEAAPHGTLLVMNHRDVPGLVGFIGTIFGKHHVNIAQMALGRELAGGMAIAVLNLDNVPSAQALAEVQTHPHIHSLTCVQLPPEGQRPPWMPG